MNCSDCKELIGALMDNELEETQAGAVREHLAFCAECAVVCEDLTSIVDACKDGSDEIVPPNSKALWLRINNMIESEVKPAPVLPPPPAPRSWGISILRFSAAVLVIAVISSTVTYFALRNYIQPPTDDFTSRSAATQTTFEKVLSKIGLVDTPQQARERRLKEREAAIEYWNARVMTRRSQWDRVTREAFDRNLQVIEESVKDYTTILNQDPEDELSGEMLDAVMNDKMNLLRDFADL